MNPNKLKNYAELAIHTGLSVDKGDILMVNCPVELQDFGRAIAEAAYEKGAVDVHINWVDDVITRLRYEHEPQENFESFPEWRKMMMDDYANRGAKIISISASDPDLLQGIPSEKIIANQKATSHALKDYRAKMMRDENSWLVISAPTVKWAKKVFPELSDDDAVEKLWETIFAATRMNEDDPIAAWDAHMSDLNARTTFLQEHNFESFHFETAKGTDLTIRLPKGHLWVSAGSVNAKGEPFVPNLPTEEIFTMPDKYGVDGVVYSTKPLIYSGQLIDEFKLEFKDGRVDQYSAKTGEKALTELFSIDDKARYLGEVALVPFKSPISDTNIIFFNTLFDENAACHLAFGEAYPTNLEGGAQLSKEELEERHVNVSLVHSDFMIGDETLNITGLTHEGEKVAIFRDGNWAF